VQSQTAGKATQAKRTDIYAPEAWKQGNSGRGVVVAVMDTLIQWDHPDLQGSLYTAKAEKRCSGEIHGWDFYSGISTQSKSEDICATGDPDTRISAAELNILRPYHQTAFSIPDSEILKSIPSELNATFKGICQTKRIPDCDGAVIRHLADQRESFIAQSFHGTSVAGVIAAQSPNQKGLTGIAPSSKILPIRVGGFSSSELGIPVDSAAVIKGLEYAEQRNVDIINMSFGGGLPIQNRERRIQKLLQDNPKLVIVASAGNGRCKNLLNQVMYPAASEGVLAVGATDLSGSRACYSHYGSRLDLVAPGGDTDSPSLLGGMLTTGGTFVDGFWQGIRVPSTGWGSALDQRGAYIWIDGTSFSSPAVAGVLALMKAEDPKRQLTRQQLIAILKKTASYDRLDISPDLERFQVHKQKGDVPNGVSPEQYFFGSGLVNAEAAVREVKRQVGR
jgi:subtilisin family serine protease